MRIYCTLFLSLFLSIYFKTIQAQVPQKFNYQGIARDATGKPLSKHALSLKLSILPSVDATISEYEEIQHVTSNEFGLYTLQIGNGEVIKGSMKLVTWETGTKYIQVAIDPKGGSNFEFAGNTELLSVPYALYADKAGTTSESTHGTRTGSVSSNAAHTASDVNFITKFTALNTIGKSALYDNGSSVSLGTTTPLARIHLYDITSGNTELRLQHTNTTAGASRLSFFNDVATGFTATANYAVLNKYAAGVAGAVGPGFANSKLFGFNNSQGSLLFSTGGNIGFGYYNQPTSQVFVQLFIDSSSGFVGMGNVLPQARLHVSGAQDTTAYFTSTSANGNYNGIVRSEYTGTSIDDHVALYGKSVPNVYYNNGIGVYGEGGYIGLYGFAKCRSLLSVYGTLNESNSRGDTYGSYSLAHADTTGNYGNKIGVYGMASGGTANYGVYGDVDSAGAGAASYAGYFTNRVQIIGNLNVTGSISKGGGTFKIDHPLDPENKYLYHSFVESPDMMNVYNGNATTDAQGVVVVTLPDYFDALNKEFRYQLTAIGQPAQLWIAEKISNNQFTIKSDKSNVEVSWQVTGIRNDAYAQAHRVEVEVEKESENKGFYLYPQELGKPLAKGIMNRNKLNSKPREGKFKK